MFPKLEAKWNSHTPKILHPRTKENFIFQLIMLVVTLGGMEVASRVSEYRRAKARNRAIYNR